jgi:hypothetical protein
MPLPLSRSASNKSNETSKVKPLVYTDYNKYLKAKKAYNDSLFVYNKYKDKEEWQGGKNVLQFEDKKEQQQYNDLNKIMDRIQNAEYAEQDALYKDPNFKRLSNDEQFNRLMAISNKYTNSKEFKEIVARTNYLYTNNTSIQGAKYTPKWFDNKNVTERGLKPISFDEKEQETSFNAFRTTKNKYGTIIARDSAVGPGSSTTVTKYSPNFKEPVQPVTFVKPITKQTAIEEQVKPLYQEPKLTMPVREELIMNRPDVKPLAEGPVFRQGRKFMREGGVNKNTQSFNKLPGWYEENGTDKKSNKKIPIKKR